jgi:hypothetical protein
MLDITQIPRKTVEKNVGQVEYYENNIRSTNITKVRSRSDDTEFKFLAKINVYKRVNVEEKILLDRKSKIKNYNNTSNQSHCRKYSFKKSENIKKIQLHAEQKSTITSSPELRSKPFISTHTNKDCNA